MSFYLVRSIYAGQPFIHETDLDGTTREQLVERIAQGQYDTGDLDAVLYVNLATGQSIDVSQSFAEALADHSHRMNDSLTDNVQAFIEAHGMTGYKPAPYRLDLTGDHPDRYSFFSRAA
jgi:hypothetical protein